MKVILKEHVKNLGEKDDVIEVKDGYARNYLFPRGLAVEANAGNLELVKSRKKAEANRAQKEKEEAEKISKKLAGITLEIKAKAGGKGKLFGSVTSMEIAEALNRSYGLNLDRKKILLDEPIKSIGKTTVEVRLYPGISTQLKINVTAQA
jgi:large subunit ribosomal protein L9